MKNKKIIIVLLSIFLFSACFKQIDEKIDQDKLQASLIEINDFSESESIYDIDGNGKLESEKDGNLIFRYLFNMGEYDSFIGNFIGKKATRFSDIDLKNYLQILEENNFLDIDGNGFADALTDGLLLIGYMLDSRGNALTDNNINSNATRTTGKEIIDFIEKQKTSDIAHLIKDKVISINLKKGKNYLTIPTNTVFYTDKNNQPSFDNRFYYGFVNNWSEVFSSIEGSYTVYGIDEKDQNVQFNSNGSTLPENLMKYLAPGKGYIISTDQDTIWKFAGEIVNHDIDIDLRQGCSNFISNPFLKDLTPQYLLQDLIAQQDNNFRFYHGYPNKIIKMPNFLKSVKAYWICVEKDITITFRHPEVKKTSSRPKKIKPIYLRGDANFDNQLKVKSINSQDIIIEDAQLIYKHLKALEEKEKIQKNKQENKNQEIKQNNNFNENDLLKGQGLKNAQMAFEPFDKLDVYDVYATILYSQLYSKPNNENSLQYCREVVQNFDSKNPFNKFSQEDLEKIKILLTDKKHPRQEEYSYYIETKFFGVQEKVEIQLNKGINLFSFPLDFSEKINAFYLLSFFGGKNKVISIEKYNGENQSWKKAYWRGSSPAGENFKFKNNDGLLITMKQANTISLQGKKFPRQIDLSIGKKLIGLQDLSANITSFDLLSKINNDQLEVILTNFIPANQKEKEKIIDFKEEKKAVYKATELSGDNFILQEDKAYFIEIKKIDPVLHSAASAEKEEKIEKTNHKIKNQPKAKDQSNKNIKISFTTFNSLKENKPPVIRLDMNPKSGFSPLKVSFNAADSYDSDEGDILSFLWDFGDGNTSKEKVAENTFLLDEKTAFKFFPISIKVTDNHGNQSSGKFFIRVMNEKLTLEVAEVKDQTIKIRQKSVVLLEAKTDNKCDFSSDDLPSFAFIKLEKNQPCKGKVIFDKPRYKDRGEYEIKINVQEQEKWKRKGAIEFNLKVKE